MNFISKHIKKVGFTAYLLVSLYACLPNDDYNIPEDVCVNDVLVPNTTFAKMKALYKDEIVQINEDLIIEGYIISSDLEDNFFGSLHLQNTPESSSEGIEIELDQKNLYLFYPVGKKVFVKLKGLYLDNDKGTYKLGGAFTAFGNKSVGRLPVANIKEHLFVSCEVPKIIKPSSYNINQLDSTKINTLVAIQNVELAPESLCKTYAEPQETTNHQLIDCEGNSVVLRNSGYASFQSVKMPMGNGEVTGVLTMERGEYIVTIRSLEDMLLVNNRCDSITYYCETPKSNTTITHIKTLFQGASKTITEELFADVTIVANDAAGSFYKEIYAQDETGGIKILIDETKLFEKGFVQGNKLTIAFKGLELSKINGELVLGYPEEDGVRGIEKEQFYRFFYLSDVQYKIDPRVVDIKSITENDIGSLVQINNVQFTEESAFVKKNRDTNHEITDCFANKLTIAISRRSLYANDLVPYKNGRIIGILQYDEKFQIRIRNAEDVALMQNERCNVYENASPITIAELKAQYGSSSEEIKENIKLRGTITSDGSTNTIEANSAIFQDETGGIEFKFKAKHDLLLNETVEIALLGAVLKSSGNVLRISAIDGTHIITHTQGATPKAISINVEEVNSNNYLYRLVEIEGLQFKNNAISFLEQNILTNCNEELEVSINQAATFIGENVPEGKGSLIGVQTPEGFYVRNKADFNFNQPYESCLSKYTSTHIFISEIADPDNNTSKMNVRFIELYNSGDESVSLNNWELRRYTNDNAEYTSNKVIKLSGYSIPAKSTFVIAANADSFATTYGFAPDMEGGTGGAADSNGDDNMELVDGNGEVVDIFGVPGEDGSNTNHEFEDGRALRKPEVVENNSTYTFSEWIIYNDTGAAGTINKPQIAPQDYNPGER